MRTTRALIVIGISCLLLAGSSVLMGFLDRAWLPLALAGVGTVMVVVAPFAGRRKPGPQVKPDLERGERLVRIATIVLAGSAVLALLVGLIVAVGQARGHAFVHFFTGLLCLGLFTALAYPWHPRAGSGAATFRGTALALLALAALGSFVESLGGAGYDATNSARRIAALTTLHDLAAPLSALVIVAFPLGLATSIAVLIAKGKHRGRPARI